MAGAWEYQPSCLVGILHTEATTIAWALGLRNLIVPAGAIMPVAGMPYDMARNAVCMKTIEGGYDYCVLGGTLIETADGAERIELLKEGDVVRTHTGGLRPVTKTMQRLYGLHQPIFDVRTRHGLLRCTPEHPVYVSRGGGPARFVRADGLLAGDEVVYPAPYLEETLDFGVREPGFTLGRIPVTRDIAEFLGFYLSRGEPSEKGVRFVLRRTEPTRIAELVRLTELVCASRRVVQQKWVTEIYIDSPGLSRTLRKWFGVGKTTKWLPEFIFGWSLVNRLAFLRAYFISNKKEGVTVYAHTLLRGKRLADDLRRLAGTCGLRTKWLPLNTRRKKEVGGRQVILKESANLEIWRCNMNVASVSKMMDVLSGTPDGNTIRIPIVSVTPKVPIRTVKTKVYNIEVEGDNSYIANSVVVHNCFFLDSDVIPPPDVIPRLIRHNVPVISGVYHRRSPPHGLPVMMKPVGKWITEYPQNRVIDVDVVGAGCLLIRRDVLEKCPPQRQGHHWFDWRVNLNGVHPEPLSEDFTLCMHLKRTMGIPILVDTSIQCRHVGYSEASYGKLEPLSCVA